MLPTDDTYVPGYLIAKTAEVVGAWRAAAFFVRPTGEGACSLELFRYLPACDAGLLSAREMADGLRRYVMPCLADDRDRVIHVPELDGPLRKAFVLVFLARVG